MFFTRRGAAIIYAVYDGLLTLKVPTCFAVIKRRCQVTRYPKPWPVASDADL